MHELALADSIARIACEHARGRRVLSVDVSVGVLRQVVPDALAFAFGLVADGTVAEGSELRINQVEARLACVVCERETVVASFPLVCAVCGSDRVDVVAGAELLVDSLELEDEPVTIGGR